MVDPTRRMGMKAGFGVCVAVARNDSGSAVDGAKCLKNGRGRRQNVWRTNGELSLCRRSNGYLWFVPQKAGFLVDEGRDRKLTVVECRCTGKMGANGRSEFLIVCHVPTW
jgi:hypothetical protein